MTTRSLSDLFKDFYRGVGPAGPEGGRGEKG